MNNLYIIFILLFNVFKVNALIKSCSGHDACPNSIWTSFNEIKCKNGERVCKNTQLNCPDNSECSIVTSGSGHDNYQNSYVFAQNANNFILTCGATGFRGCQNNKIWCPVKKNSICKCTGCKSSTKLYCAYGNTCSGGTVINLNEAYCTGAESQMWCDNDNCNIQQCPSNENKCASVKGTDKTHYSMTCKCPNNVFQIPNCPSYHGNYINNKLNVWTYNKENIGKRPKCDDIAIKTDGSSYHWGTLEECKNKCINEPSGLCNIVSRYGETFKNSDENYHCWFFACENPTNITWITQTKWGNGADKCGTYIIKIRHHEKKIFYKNVTSYVNKTNYNNVTRYIDTPKYINISDYFYNNDIIENICFEGQYKYYNSLSNEGWTRNSWQLGCKQYKLGYTSISKCKSQCQCNKSPISYSSHSKYRQCNKNFASTNYLPCRQNACSGGNCCSRSTTICKSACNAYHGIKFSGEIISYQNVEVIKYKDIYTNKTRYINKTRCVGTNVTLYNNKTNYYNVTRYINKTRYVNKIKYINKTKCVGQNVTLYNNKTNYYNITRYINKYIYKNITRFKNYTKCISSNKTIYINNTKYTNIIRYIDKITYINVTNYINKTLYNNITRYTNKIRYKNVTRYFDKVRYDNFTKSSTNFTWASFNNITYYDLNNTNYRIVFKENSSISSDINSNKKNFDKKDNFLSQTEILLIGICILLAIIFLIREIYNQFCKDICCTRSYNDNINIEDIFGRLKVDKSTQTGNIQYFI